MTIPKDELPNDKDELHLDLVDFFSQLLFEVAANCYDAGRDGKDAGAIAPPERAFELRKGFPAANRRAWRDYTRKALIQLREERSRVAKVKLDRHSARLHIARKNAG